VLYSEFESSVSSTLFSSTEGDLSNEQYFLFCLQTCLLVFANITTVSKEFGLFLAKDFRSIFEPKINQSPTLYLLQKSS